MLDLEMQYIASIASYVYGLIHFNKLDLKNMDSGFLQITSVSGAEL